MAIARKCDICGTYYEPYNIANSKREVESNRNAIAFVSINDNDKYFSSTPMDCCPKCLESIRRHIDDLKGE